MLPEAPIGWNHCIDVRISKFSVEMQRGFMTSRDSVGSD